MLTRKRPAIIEGNIAKIPLGKNAKYGYSIVDKEFAYLADNHFFCVDGRGYVKVNINGKNLRLHRIILNTDKDMVVDHINHDVKDNRRINLRQVTQRQNTFNSKISKNNTSGFKGVSRKGNKWRAYLGGGCNNPGQINGGVYDTPEEAAIKYNEMALEYYGEHAFLNEVKL